MPIDSSNSPSDGGLGPDPASTKVGPDDVGKIELDLDLDDAGTGAKSTDGLDLPGTNSKAGLDLDLDDAGRGAKVDPSLGDADDAVTPADKSGVGGALDQVGDDDDAAVKDLDQIGDDDAVVKDLDIGAPDHLHEDHIKGLTGESDLHGDDHDHDDLHDHDHDDVHDH